MTSETPAKRLTIDDIVPVPKQPQDITAAVLARYYAAHAQLHFRLALEHPDDEKRRRSVGDFCNYYMIAGLLRALAERGDEQADETARDLWENLGAGHVAGPEVWTWLEAGGVDPNRIIGVAEQILAEGAGKWTVTLPLPDFSTRLDGAVPVPGPLDELEIREGHVVNEDRCPSCSDTIVAQWTPAEARAFAAYLAALADRAEAGRAEVTS